jgi:hypothetical protein
MSPVEPPALSAGSVRNSAFSARLLEPGPSPTQAYRLDHADGAERSATTIARAWRIMGSRCVEGEDEDEPVRTDERVEAIASSRVVVIGLCR